MQSEVRVKTPNIKIHIVIGVFMFLTVVFLSLTYRVETGFILLMFGAGVGGVGATIVGGRVIGLLRCGAVAYYDIQDRRQETRLKSFQADRAKLEARVIHFPHTHTTAMLPGNVQLLPGVVEGEAKVLSPQQSQTFPHIQDVLRTETDVIFKGRKRSGKTYQAMQWLGGRGKCLVVDPKNEGSRE